MFVLYIERQRGLFELIDANFTTKARAESYAKAYYPRLRKKILTPTQAITQAKRGRK